MKQVSKRLLGKVQLRFVFFVFFERQIYRKASGETSKNLKTEPKKQTRLPKHQKNL